MSRLLGGTSSAGQEPADAGSGASSSGHSGNGILEPHVLVPGLIGAWDDDGEARLRPGRRVRTLQKRPPERHPMQELGQQDHRRDVGVVGTGAVQREHNDGRIRREAGEDPAHGIVDSAIHLAEPPSGRQRIDRRVDRVVECDPVPQRLPG